MESSGNKNKINIFSQNSFVFNGGNNPTQPEKKNPANIEGSNPFGISNTSFNKSVQNNKPVKRLNGYDSTILNKANFEEGEGEISIGYRIKEKESILKDLDEKIKLADNYGTQNEALGLKAKKQRIMQELATLQKQQAYGGRFLSSEDKLFHQKFKQKMPVLYKIQDFISRYILAKVSKKIHSVVTLNDSLEQLSDISKSVDELIDLNVPYGEKIQNYEKLTEYLSRANVIHSKISKSLRK